MSNVKFVKLKSGEEFIADIEETETGLIAENPVTVSQRYNDNNEIETALIPWCAFAKSRKIPVESSDVMLILDTTDNMISVYTQQFATIIQPNSPKILHS